MKSADIRNGLDYAVKLPDYGMVKRATCTGFSTHSRVIVKWQGKEYWVVPQSVKAPWPEYEAKKTAEAERDRAVQEERERHAQLVEAQIDEQWTINLQIQELRGELAARGVENYKHSGHGVTLSWADLAKVLGMKAP